LTGSSVPHQVEVCAPGDHGDCENGGRAVDAAGLAGALVAGWESALAGGGVVAAGWLEQAEMPISIATTERSLMGELLVRASGARAQGFALSVDLCAGRGQRLVAVGAGEGHRISVVATEARRSERRDDGYLRSR
jgi:hypothetical protein